VLSERIRGLNPVQIQSPPARAVACDVVAHAAKRIPLEDLAQLRRQPGPVCGKPLPLAFLKHADEQTVVALAAVYQAIHDHHLTPPFTRWGVLAAPRFLGRPTLVAALQRFAAEGAWGVSPHLIPHRSLHAIAGTVSQALQIHGPNFGVGGGPGAAGEVLLAAAAMLECQRLPGVWVVLSALDPEDPPDDTGHCAPGTHAVGMALALAPAEPGWKGIRVQVLGGTALPSDLAEGARVQRADFDLLRLQALLTQLEEPGRAPARIVQTVANGPGLCSRIELTRGQERQQGTKNSEQPERIARAGCCLSPVPCCGEAQR
jgi:hypothetical protein